MFVSRQGGRRLPQPARATNEADGRDAAKATSLMIVIPGKSSPGTLACPSSGLAPFEPAGPCHPRSYKGMYHDQFIQKCGPFGAATSQQAIPFSGTMGDDPNQRNPGVSARCTGAKNA